MSIKKIIVGAGSLLVLLVGVVAGVILVQRQQDIREKAAPTPAATLSLRRASQGSINTNDEFEVEVVADSAGEVTIATDLVINYPRNMLSIVDADPATNGVQIQTSGLYANTIYANGFGVDTANGIVDMSMYNTNNGTTLSSSVLATITFRAISSGQANINFEFLPGATNDTNILAYQPGEAISQATDLLVSATGLNLTIEASSLPTDTPTPTPTTAAAIGGALLPTSTPTPTTTQTPTPTSEVFMPTTAAGLTQLPDTGIGTPAILVAGLGIMLLIFAIVVFTI